MIKNKEDLAERLFRFAVDVLKYLKSIKSSIENNVIKNQLAKAATSGGANYEESQAASSRADFTNKVKISLKEMRESSDIILLNLSSMSAIPVINIFSNGNSCKKTASL